MRSLKKLLAVLIALTLMASIMVVPAFAAESFKYEDEAKALYDLGLFKGTSATEYKPALDARLERQEGAVLVLRLFNLEEEANKMDEKEAKALLTEKFKDADEIGAWAVKAIAYAVKNEIINGRPDGKFAPKDPLLGKEFSKMILAELGQKYDFQTACADLAAVSDLTAAEAIAFNDKILIRDDVVGISFASLAGTYADGKTVISVLAEDPAFKAKAMELGLFEIVKINTVVEPIAIKVGEKVELPAKAEVEYNDGSKAEVDLTWDTAAVKTDVAGEYKAVGSVAGFDGKIEVAVTVTPDVLAVESVTADNLKEIVVVYNQDVAENAAVADKANYTLDIGKKVTAVKVDGNTAILTVENGVENQKKAKLTIADKILTAKEVIEFTFFDGTLPEVLNLEVTGPKSVNIKFSEPIAKYGKITLKSGSSTLSVNTQYTGLDTATISVPLYSSFSEGKTYEITIKEFEDYAEYKNVIKTIEFSYEKDETPPVATIATVKQEYVKVTFNKPVKGLTPSHFSHTFTAWKAISLTKTDSFVKYVGETDPAKAKNVVKKDESVSTVYVWFYNDGSDKTNERAIPEGSTSFRIVVKNSDGVEIKDEWGNKVEELNATIEVAADKTAPAVSSVEVTSERELKIKFSKNVIFTKDNIEVLAEDGSKIDGVKLNITSVSAKEYKVDLGKALAGKTILVNIKKVEDTTLSANKMADYSQTIEITDKTAPVVNSVTYEELNADERYLYVTYNESLDTETALKVSNYFLLKGGSYTKLTGSTSFFSGEKIVKIALSKTELAAVKVADKLFVTGVKDAAGNEIVPSLSSIAGAEADYNKPVFNADKVKATATDKVEAVFNQELASVNENAFKVVKYAGDVLDVDGKLKADYAKTSYDIVGMDLLMDGGNTKIILTLDPDTKIPFDAKNIKIVIADGSKIENLFGTKAVNGVNAVVADKIAPALKAGPTQFISNNEAQIALTFEEDIKWTVGNDLAASDFVITDDDSNVLVAGKNYTLENYGGPDVVISLLGKYAAYRNKLSIKTSDARSYITDMAGNKIAAVDKSITLTDRSYGVERADSTGGTGLADYVFDKGTLDISMLAKTDANYQAVPYVANTETTPVSAYWIGVKIAAPVAVGTIDSAYDIEIKIDGATTAVKTKKDFNDGFLYYFNAGTEEVTESKAVSGTKTLEIKWNSTYTETITINYDVTVAGAGK